jgi:hypothetical protein
MSFKIEKTEMPEGLRTNSVVYDSVISAVLNKQTGSYVISMDGVKPDSMYVQLAKRTKEKSEQLRIHRIKGRIYIEKLAKKVE